MAYPKPEFKWFRNNNSMLFEASDGFTNIINISENEYMIEYTVSNVAADDFGQYVLTINNTFGSYQQSFFLIEKGRYIIDMAFEVK